MADFILNVSLCIQWDFTVSFIHLFIYLFYEWFSLSKTIFKRATVRVTLRKPYLTKMFYAGVCCVLISRVFTLASSSSSASGSHVCIHFSYTQVSMYYLHLNFYYSSLQLLAVWAVYQECVLLIDKQHVDKQHVYKQHDYTQVNRKLFV